MKTAYLSEKAYPDLKAWLTKKGYTLVQLLEGDKPYPSISAHPDIYMCDVKGKLFKAKRNEIGDEFPNYLGYNGVFLDKYFIHNLKYTSPVLLEEAKCLGVRLINVKQGYTKCSCVVVDGESVITSDEGILRALRNYPDINVLPIRQGYVGLSGFECGFIGGTSGRIGNNVIFNGDLDMHPDGDAIRKFVRARGLEAVDFKGRVLYDIGSVFAEE